MVHGDRCVYMHSGRGLGVWELLVGEVVLVVLVPGAHQCPTALPHCLCSALVLAEP